MSNNGPRKVSWNTHQRELFFKGLKAAGTISRFATKLMENQEELGVKAYATFESASASLGQMKSNPKRMTAPQSQEVILYTAEAIIEEKENKPSHGESPLPLPADLPKHVPAEELHSVRAELMEEQKKADDYRAEALKHQQVERRLEQENVQLKDDLDGYEEAKIDLDKAVLLLRHLMFQPTSELRAQAALFIMEHEHQAK